MVKMIDVANHAGVSIKTVSRVINNETTVQKDYREKVLRSIKDLNYVPSASARTLRSNRSYQVIFISNSSRNSFANRVLFGALRTCHKIGYQLVLELIEDEQIKNLSFVDDWIGKLSLKNKPEGIIVFPPLSLNKSFTQKLIEENIPVVNIGGVSIHKKQASVKIDDQSASEEITSYLINKGHRRIGFVLGAKGQSATIERFKGYKAALQKNNLEFDNKIIYQGDFQFESGVAAGKDLLSHSSRPTAIFSSNDEMAAGIVFSAQKMGIAIPSELSLVGFDDNALIKGLWPSLTTIRQPLEEFGRTAIEMISNLRGDIDNVDVELNKCLKYELVERNSVVELNL